METLNELTLGFSFFIKIITNVQLGRAKISIKFIIYQKIYTILKIYFQYVCYKKMKSYSIKVIIVIIIIFFKYVCSKKKKLQYNSYLPIFYKPI